MKYYFKFGKRLQLSVFINVTWLLICWSNVIWPHDDHQSNFYLYFGILFVGLAIVAILKNYSLIKLAIKIEPVLEVDEVYIIDCVKGIKYYWDDIDEVFEDDDNILKLSIYNPAKYLSQLKSGLDRYYTYSKNKKVFKINLDCVKVNRKDLVNNLEKFSVIALETQKSK